MPTDYEGAASGTSKPKADGDAAVAVAEVEDAMKALGALGLNDEGGKQAAADAAAAGPGRVLPNLDLALPSLDLKGLAEYISKGHKGKTPRNIICMVGAGISVSAGIPDFRTPGTGLYSQLEKYNLPTPESVFNINYFESNPQPFFTLAAELWPGRHRPTPTHYFIRLLHEKGLLLRCWSQNIDSLETAAGLPKDKLVAAHGNFDGAHCIHAACARGYPAEYVHAAIMKGEPSTCKYCGSLVKPDIVFFGENLPERFFRLVEPDFKKCDLLIVMGTSLQVHPFAGLIHRVEDDVPRVLVNREVVSEAGPPSSLRQYWEELDACGGHGVAGPRNAAALLRGFMFPGRVGVRPSLRAMQEATKASPSASWPGPGNDMAYRDVLLEGDCDGGVRQLCAALGWTEELEALIAKGSGKGSSGGAVKHDKDKANRGRSKGCCAQ